MRIIKHPIERDTFANQMRRVVYKLIALEYYRDSWEPSTHIPTKILNLGIKLRLSFPALYPWFLYYAKGIGNGHTLNYLRDCDIPAVYRAVHKRRIPRPR